MLTERARRGGPLAPFTERLARRPETLATLLLAVAGLRALHAQTGDPDARVLAAQGIEQILTLMPRFDLGDWSARDTSGIRASAPRHARHIRELARLAHETGDQRLLGWHDRFVEYRDNAGGKLKLPWKSGQPAGDNYHGRIARSYLSRRVHKPIWQAEHDAVDRFLNKMPHGQSVLDLPFGTGRFVPLYLARGMEVTGVDISQAMLDEARRALGPQAEAVTMLRGDAQCLPFADGTFDGVVSVRFLGSIIPFAQVAPVLREMHRVVRHWAIMRLNTRYDNLPPLDDLPDDDAVLGYHLNAEQLAVLCRSCGWELKEDIVVGRRTGGKRIGEQRIHLLSRVP